ncbi:DUF4266 domain-containing protein [Tenacibaculum sp. nBUS_03]|uniref:DUF4266 domain-containing protein n=1 Tax=Tenacibaculum sp. nBUS_03 TaxID=3395320 RepID=UPI003EBC9613
MIKKGLSILLFTVICTSCATVKPYQKMYLNDENMALSSRKIEQYEINSQNYREGAAGANGSKSGGGCGCN